MPHAFITGAGRGIGFALTEAFAERGWEVTATCRAPEAAAALQDLAVTHRGLIRIERLDVADLAAIEALAARVARPIDALINNAGIAWRDARFGTLDYDAWRRVLDVNLMAPMRVAEAFLEQVAASDHRKIVSISSSLGSIAAATGGNYFYRTSKTALNMAMRNLAKDLAPRSVVVSLLSPGYVDTDFTRAAVGGPPKISARDSGQGLAEAIIALTPEDSGRFMRFNGQAVDW
jgi:NAD(P)-dependent dehydrogenase (short-subunit alcohol dehydrogenase family)